VATGEHVPLGQDAWRSQGVGLGGKIGVEATVALTVRLYVDRCCIVQKIGNDNTTRKMQDVRNGESQNQTRRGIHKQKKNKNKNKNEKAKIEVLRNKSEKSTNKAALPMILEATHNPVPDFPFSPSFSYFG